MLVRSTLCGIILTLLCVQKATGQEPVTVDTLLTDFYNNFDSVESNREVKNDIEKLIEEHPNDPHLYSFRATVEWTLIGHELRLKMNENKNISKDNMWAKRLQTHNEMIDRGIALTNNKTDPDSIFARTALFFERGKLIYRFGNGPKSADLITAEGIRILNIENLPCQTYFFLGTIRFGMSTQGKLGRFAIYLFSKNYEVIQKLDRDVFNIKKSVKWLELAYQCDYDTIIHKKMWAETAFFLVNAYNTIRKNLSTTEELAILEKEIVITDMLTLSFPKNKDIAQHHVNLKLRHAILANYIARSQ